MGAGVEHAFPEEGGELSDRVLGETVAPSQRRTSGRAQHDLEEPPQIRLERERTRDLENLTHTHTHS